MIALKKIKNTVFKYLLYLFVFEVLIFFILELSFKHSFSYVPYYRLLVITFTFFFFFPILFFKTKRITLRLLTNEDYLVIGWCLFTIIELIHGMLIRNPLVYIVADFTYIIFGGFIYLLLSNYISTNKTSTIDFVNLSNFLLVIFVLFFFVNGFFSENYYFILLSLCSVFLIEKKYKYVILLIIPFLLQIKDSNRALLICFLTVVIFYFLYRITYFLRKNDRLFIFTFSFFIFYFFYQEILTLLFELVPKGSGLYYRLKQLLEILNKGINFNDPQYVSITQRLIEAKVVINLWFSDLLTFIFGCGLGSVIDGNLFIDASVKNTALLGVESIHNIHLLPFALIHKYGFFGLLIFIILVIDVLNSFNNLFKKNVHIAFIFWNLIFILIFIYSLPAASFLWTSPLFWISVSLKRKQIYIN